MAESINDLSYDYHDEDGTLKRKELGKEVLTKGAWSTIMFHYEERNPKTGEMGAPKAAIVRYQKKDGAYRKRSSFNISNAKQARRMVEILAEWFPPEKS